MFVQKTLSYINLNKRIDVQVSYFKRTSLTIINLLVTLGVVVLEGCQFLLNVIIVDYLLIG